jgi:hypothetical protein
MPIAVMEGGRVWQAKHEKPVCRAKETTALASGVYAVVSKPTTRAAAPAEIRAAPSPSSLVILWSRMAILLLVTSLLWTIRDYWLN